MIFNRKVIHHLNITGKTIGYLHSFCNQKVRQNKNQISVIAHITCLVLIFFRFKRSQAKHFPNN